MSNFTRATILYASAHAHAKIRDVTAESRNSGARARHPLLNNGSEIKFPLQRRAGNKC
jgi:hypothetical protein